MWRLCSKADNNPIDFKELAAFRGHFSLIFDESRSFRPFSAYCICTVLLVLLVGANSDVT
jgi:hypothetical protein